MRTRGRKPVSPTVLLLGPQGSGKGTQAELLAKKFRAIHVEMGAILRGLRRRKQQTQLTRRTTELIDHGRLVPSAWVIRILAERLKTISPRRGLILDGSARRLREARVLERVLRKFGRAITNVVLIDISRKESIARLSKRWMCSRHRHTLTMGTDVKRPTDRCPTCGSTIEQRADDRPAAIAKRLATYRRETGPAIMYFENKGMLTRIDGERTVAEVFRDVVEAYRDPRT